MVQFNERTPVAVSRRTVQRKLHFFGYTIRSVRKKISIITVKKKRIAWCRGDIWEGWHSRVCSTWHTSGNRGSIWDKSGSRRCCRPQEGRIKGFLNSLFYKIFPKSCWFGELNIRITGLDNISARAWALRSILDAWISWTLPIPTGELLWKVPVPTRGLCMAPVPVRGLWVLTVPVRRLWLFWLSSRVRRLEAATYRVPVGGLEGQFSTSVDLDCFFRSRQASCVNYTFDRLTFFRCPRFTNLTRKFTVTNSMMVTIIVIIQNINQFITLYTKFEIRWHHVIYT